MIPRDPLDAVPGLEHPWVQLAVSVLFDVIGMLGYVIPMIGELGDVVWAPIQAIFIGAMVGREHYGLYFVVIGFTEEILPFTDFVPSCTIAWIWKNARR